MDSADPGAQAARCRRTTQLAGAVLLGTAGLAIGSLAAAALPASVAGASNPASLNCGTLVINGTDANNYQFSEFTTGNATRGPNIDSGGSVAYGGNLSASNFTVAQNITPSAGTPTAIVGGNMTSGPLTEQKGSAAVAGTVTGTINFNGGGSLTHSLPFTFSSIGSALAACSNNYGPNATTSAGTIADLNVPGFPTLALYGTGAVNVFSVTTDQLVGIKKIDFSVPVGSTTLVEISPSSDFNGSLDLTGMSGNIDYNCPQSAPTNTSWNSGNCGSQPSPNENTTSVDVERNNTVWNLAPNLFPASDTLSVTGWQGTIVAPNQPVTLNSNGQFDGSIFAASITGGGQTNFDPFGGTAPSSYQPIPALAEGLPILMGGVGAVVVIGGLALQVRHRRSSGRKHTPA